MSATPRPDRRNELARSGLMKFLGMHTDTPRPWPVLYTDFRRPTRGFRGIADAEVYAMVERGWAVASETLLDGRKRVTLTPEGKVARDQLAPGAGRGRE